MAIVGSIPECLGSSDPLSMEVFRFLVEYREEDSRVDFKESFVDDEKHWLDLTKDSMAFANSCGGYLVYGVRDGTYDKVGLTAQLESLLANTNLLHQKVNRHLEPEISTLRSKSFEQDGKRFVVLHVPESVARTHVVSKDGAFEYPSGEKRVVLRQGTIWVRRPAGNHLAASDDLERIIARRGDLSRRLLLANIARVVEAPPETEVLVVSREGNGRRFVITDAPDAIQVKGLSFSISPQTAEEE